LGRSLVYFLPQWWIDMPHLTKEILPMGIIPTIRMELYFIPHVFNVSADSDPSRLYYVILLYPLYPFISLDIYRDR